MFVLGITGGIASGKSTVSTYIAEKGVPIIDGDKICHELSQPNKVIWQVYYEHFGKGILNEDNTLNRKAIGAKVFNDEKERQWMNATLHPIIKQEILARLKEACQDAEIVVLDIPLLFEAKWDKYCDCIWVVYVDRASQIRRVVARDNATEEEAIKRIEAQMPVDEKIALADVAISTAEDFAITKYIVEDEWQKLLASIQGKK